MIELNGRRPSRGRLRCAEVLVLVPMLAGWRGLAPRRGSAAGQDVLENRRAGAIDISGGSQEDDLANPGLAT